MKTQTARALIVLILIPAGGHAAVVNWVGDVNDNWQTGGNWSFWCPNPPLVCGWFPPGEDDEAVLTDTTFGNDVDLSADVRISRLTVGNGMHVNTNGHELLVAHGGFPNSVVDGSGSTVIVSPFLDPNQPGWEFWSHQLEVINGGRVSMSGGNVYSAYTATIGAGSSLGGTGRAHLHNFGVPGSAAVVNNGTIAAAFGSLFLETDDDAFDLDGTSGNGVVDVDDGTFFATDLLLRVNGPLTDPFDGTLQIGDGDRAEFLHAWQLGTTTLGSGLLEMNGRDGPAATLAGADVTVRGPDTLIDIQSGTATFVSHLDVSEATLRAHDNTNVQFSVDGAVFAADATFETVAAYNLLINSRALVEINQTEFDWDGNGDHFTLINNGHLRINSNRLNALNSYNGSSLHVIGGTVEVNTSLPWRMNGWLDLQGVSTPTSILGQKLLIGDDSDTGAFDARVDVEGFLPRIYADVHFNSDSKVFFEPLALLGVYGATTIEAGATFQGDGAIVNQGDLDVEHGAVVGVSIDNRGLLTINGSGPSGHAQVQEFRQEPDGQLRVRLRSAALGIHDRLDVVGTARLDGELMAINTGALMPTFGDSYTILTAADVVGEFADADNLPNTASGSRWRVIYEPNEVTLLVTASGDLNDDGFYDCADVNSLVAQIVSGNHTVTFDLTGDGFVDEDDLTQWLADAGAENLASGNPFLVGDANLDGHVNVTDFDIWNQNKFTNTAAWCSGDFNADGIVNGRDFLSWNANKGMSADTLAAVPEPSGQLVLLLAAVAFRVWSPLLR